MFTKGIGQKNFRWDIIIIFCLALAIRLIYVGGLDPYKGDSDDSVYWLETGHNIAAGQGHYAQATETQRSYASKGPLYSVLIAVAVKIFGNNLFGLRMIQSILMALTCVFMMLIGRKMFGIAAGRLAGAIFAVYPFAIYYSGYIGSEALFVALFAAFIWRLYSLRPGSPKYEAVLCGCLLGLSTLTRPIPLYLPLFLIVGLLWRYHGRAKREMLKSFGIIMLAMVVILLPWGLRNLKVTGHFILTTTEAGYTFFSGNNSEVYARPHLRGTYWIPEQERIDRDKVPEFNADKSYFQKGLSFVKQNPGKFVYLSLYKFVRFWRLYPQVGFGEVINRKVQLVSLLSYGVILPFFILGLALSLRFWKRFTYFYGTILYFCGLSMVFYGSTRLRFPISVIFIIFAANGMLIFLTVLKKGFMTRGGDV